MLYVVYKASCDAIAMPASYYNFFPSEYHSDECVKRVCAFESFATHNILRYRVITNTVYNHLAKSHKLTGDDCKALLMVVATSHHDGLTPKEVERTWMSGKRKYISLYNAHP